MRECRIAHNAALGQYRVEWRRWWGWQIAFYRGEWADYPWVFESLEGAQRRIEEYQRDLEERRRIRSSKWEVVK